MGRIIFLIIVFGCLWEGGFAQIKGIDKGDQVRVTSVYDQEITGKVIAILPSELRLLKPDSSQVDILVYDIDELQVRTQISKTVRGALKGAAIGGLTMGFFTMATFSGDNFFAGSQSRGEWFLEGARAGIVFGSVIGLLVGAVQKDQWWKKKEVNFTVSPVVLGHRQPAMPGITAKYTFLKR